MSRNRQGDKKPNRASLSKPFRSSLLSKLGIKLIFGGIFVVVLGFWVLSASDPLGRNWASLVSPILILGGYLLIALGIIWPFDFPSLS